MSTNSRSGPVGSSSTAEPLIPERDDSWCTEHIDSESSESEDSPGPGWTRRPIRLPHNPEEVEAWKQFKDPEYWSRKFREKEEQAKKKVSSASSNQGGGDRTDEAAAGAGTAEPIGTGTEGNTVGGNSEPATSTVPILPASNSLVTVSARDWVRLRHESKILQEFKDFSIMRKPELQMEFHAYKLAQASAVGGGGPTVASTSSSAASTANSTPINPEEDVIQID